MIIKKKGKKKGKKKKKREVEILILQLAFMYNVPEFSVRMMFYMLLHGYHCLQTDVNVAFCKYERKT